MSSKYEELWRTYERSVVDYQRDLKKAYDLGHRIWGGLADYLECGQDMITLHGVDDDIQERMKNAAGAVARTPEGNFAMKVALRVHDPAAPAGAFGPWAIMTFQVDFVRQGDEVYPAVGGKRYLDLTDLYNDMYEQMMTFLLDPTPKRHMKGAIGFASDEAPTDSD